MWQHTLAAQQKVYYFLSRIFILRWHGTDYEAFLERKLEKGSTMDIEKKNYILYNMEQVVQESILELQAILR